MEEHLENLKEQVTARYEHLEESKRVGLLVHATKRLFEVEGLDLAGLLALELFTTIIPLILLGYSWASHFDANLSFGDWMIKWMELKGESAVQVRNLFGTSANLKSTWTVIGIAGFLFWGIPMRRRWPRRTRVPSGASGGRSGPKCGGARSGSSCCSARTSPRSPSLTITTRCG